MNAIQTALKMETDAIKFYGEAAEKTTNLVGKKMFLSIVEDEKIHLQMLNQFLGGYANEIRDAASPIKAIKTIFEEMKDQMMQRVAASKDELEAFRIAMEMEQEGKEYYNKTASESQITAEKELFTKLAAEEAEHYTIFSNTYNFLKDTGNWFLREEQGMIEG